MKKVMILLLCGFVFMDIQAQRRIVVMDLDTHLPVKDVAVKAGSHQVVMTDYLGRVEIPIVFDSIAFSHVRYEHERLAMTEVGDTMYLLPKDHMLPEVNIVELDPRVKGLISGWAMAGAMEGAALAPRGVASFDFANLLDRRGRRDRKHLERAKKILKDWDEKPVATE